MSDLRTSLELGPDDFVENFSPMGDQRTPCQLVLQIEMGSPVFEQMNKVIGDGPGVHLASLKRHGARQVHGTDNHHAVSDDLLTGLGQRAVSALLGGKVHNDGACPHSA